MIAADEFLEPARLLGFDFLTGVPCSFLTPFINRAISHPDLTYVGAASEGEAVAIAAGAWLAGRKTVVMCQNSGLGNAVNPLTSLNYPFRIPTLLIVTWRGEPGVADEPQHELMGQITASMLDLMQIPHHPFPTRMDEIEATLSKAAQKMASLESPLALIMGKGSVSGEKLGATTAVVPGECVVEDMCRNGDPPPRHEILRQVLAVAPDGAAIIVTTGKSGRELFTLEDRPQQLYVVGSMGGASGMGLGVAMNSDRSVVVLDGDGAALMKLGTIATIGACAPKNLIHTILDNGVHDSTGGQATVSASVDFAGLAKACGYARATTCDDPAGFADVFSRAFELDGPHLIHVRIAPGSMPKVGRPNIAPRDVARRFQDFLAGRPQ
jgi:phosphonopyruvate decarboxylase